MAWPASYDEYVLKRTVRPTDLLGVVGINNHATLHNDIGETLDVLQQIIGLDTGNEWQNGRWQGVTLLQEQKDIKSGKTVVLNHIGRNNQTAGSRQTFATQMGYGFAQGTSFTSQLTVIPDQAAGIQVKFETLAGKITWAGGPTVSATATHLAVDKPVSVAKGTANDHAARLDQVMPIGAVIAWGGTVANIPAGWQLCDGGACKGSLAAVIGRTTVPDLRGRFILGHGQGVGLTNRSAHQTPAGVERHQLSVAEMPSHNHHVGGHGLSSTSGHGATHDGGTHSHPAWTGNHAVEGQHYHEIWAVQDIQYVNKITGAKARRLTGYSPGDPSGGMDGIWSGPHGHSVGMSDAGNHNHGIALQGGNSTHENMPPFYVLVYIIKHSHA